MPSKTRHVFYIKGLFSTFYYLLDSPKGPPKQTTHTQFLFGTERSMLQRKTDSQNDENNKPLYHPHAEKSRVGGKVIQ